MEGLKKTYFFFGKIRDISLISIMTFVICLVIVQVVLRYVASGALRPFAWGDELIRNLSAWIFFLGASLAAREGAHMSIEFIVKKVLKGKVRFAVEKLVGVVILIVLGIVIVYGFQSAFNNPASMVNLPSVPMSIFFLSIPIGFIYVFVDYLLILIFGYHPFSRKALAEKAKKLDSSTQKKEIELDKNQKGGYGT